MLGTLAYPLIARSDDPADPPRPPNDAQVKASSVLSSNPICAFTKPFNSLTADQIGAQAAALGFQGIEAPIRSDGHVRPEAVVDELPRFVEDLKKHGQQVLIIASDVNDPNHRLSCDLLETARGLGIRYYRMKYFKYDVRRSLTEQIERWRSQMKDLAALNRQLGLTAIYQNHVGRDYFGAPIWDLHRALEHIDPTEIGVAYDIRHACVEGGTCWPLGFHLIRPHIQAVYVKDFQWTEKGAISVPLGQGRVDRHFFELLKQTEFKGPISLHEEYLDHRQPSLVPNHWSAMETDLATLRSWL
jgi:sugar phosphate isomerase/epimerase